MKYIKCVCGYEYEETENNTVSSGYDVTKGSLPFVKINVVATLQRNERDNDNDIAEIFACPYCGTLKIL